jgi:hypothetical protein
MLPKSVDCDMPRRRDRISSLDADNLEPRRARIGTGNPERVSNPFWHFRIAHALALKGLIPKEQADAARAAWKIANGNKSISDSVIHPLWSFDRFGQTATALPDGRILFVGGEHEDWYDPDFFIYNDVVVLHPDRQIEIFCYPESIFPPTDFHSATLVGSTLILIGSIGYPGRRRYGRTQVLGFDTDTFRISRMEPKGDGPGWVHKHTCEKYGENSVRVSGGEVLSLAQGREHRISQVSNSATFVLDLTSLKWSKIT